MIIQEVRKKLQMAIRFLDDMEEDNLYTKESAIVGALQCIAGSYNMLKEFQGNQTKTKHCLNCIWDLKPHILPLHEISICLQGKSRIIEKMNIISVDHCHDWEEKFQENQIEIDCFCQHWAKTKELPTSIFKLICKQCGRVYQ